MKDILESLRAAIRQENWHAALALALALPDICGSVSGAKQGRARYVDWCAKYVVPTYTIPLGPFRTITTFMTGEDLYLLRCAFLHQGEFDLDDPRARATLTNFRFVAPPKGWMLHRVRVDSTLQLQVSIFCEEIAQAVETFLADVVGDNDAQARLSALAVIDTMKDGSLRI